MVIIRNKECRVTFIKFQDKQLLAVVAHITGCGSKIRNILV